MVPTFIMASWEEDARAKEKKEGSHLSVGANAQGVSKD